MLTPAISYSLADAKMISNDKLIFICSLQKFAFFDNTLLSLAETVRGPDA